MLVQLVYIIFKKKKNLHVIGEKSNESNSISESVSESNESVTESVSKNNESVSENNESVSESVSESNESVSISKSHKSININRDNEIIKFLNTNTEKNDTENHIMNLDFSKDDCISQLSKKSIKPILPKKLMVSEDYKNKRSLILTIRSYLEMFYDSKDGIRILIGVKNKNDLPLFNSRLYEYSVDELEKLKSNIQFEINVNENSNMIIELCKTISHGYEKTLCSIGFDISDFTNSLFNDKMFIDNLKLLSCEFNFSDYISPTKAILFAIVKQTILINKINQIKHTLTTNDSININNNLNNLNNITKL